MNKFHSNHLKNLGCRVGRGLPTPSRQLHPNPSQNRTSGFPSIRLFRQLLREPPNDEMGSGLCGFLSEANRSNESHHWTSSMYTPGAGSYGWAIWTECVSPGKRIGCMSQDYPLWRSSLSGLLSLIFPVSAFGPWLTCCGFLSPK